MRRIVLIDVTKTDALVFYFFQNGILRKQKTYKGKHPDFLSSLDSFFKYNALTWKKIDALALLDGQGSFSRVRSAAAVLNVIYLLKKKNIFGLDVRTFFSFEEIIAAAQKEAEKKHGQISPIYGGEPITYPHVRLS